MLLLVPKEKLVNVRLTPKTHEEFKIACELRGASMSSLLHQFIVRTIREEKDMSPHSFVTERSVNGKRLAPNSAKGMPIKIEKQPRRKAG